MVVPYQLTQLFVISCELGDRYIPLFFVLMKRKTTELYKLVLQKISILVPRFNPTNCVSDFEAAIIAAFRAIYPGIINRGCFFHLKYSFIKKIKELRLFRLYKQSNEFKQWASILMSLGLLPALRILPFFERLTRSFVCGSGPQQSQISKLVSYCKNVWLRDLTLTDWLNSDLLTNNFSESTNKQCNARKPNSHLAVYS